MKRIASRSLVVLSALSFGCETEKAPEPIPLAMGTARIEARVGERIVLAAPAKPVHPRYAGARVAARLDQAFLRLAAETMDTKRLGASTAQLELEVLKAGASEVTVDLVLADGTVAKSVRYVVEAK